MKYMSNTKWLFLMMMAPVFGWAQQAQSAGTTYFSNALFNTLLVVILMLLILVTVLSNSIKNIIQSDYFKERYKKIKDMQTGKNLMILFLVFFASQLQAQNTPVSDGTIGGVDQFTFYFMLSVIFLEVIVVILLFNILRAYTKNELSVVMHPDAKASPAKPERTILDVFNASVEIEKEEEIMLDHDYDGIKELDNNLPPWWKYGFYLTILVSVVYLIHYHVTGTGDLQTAEYNKEIAKAKLEVEEFMRTSANNVDETTVKYLSASNDLDAGSKIFMTNCVACHGKAGEGNTVGPNLTDNYSLHGGSMVDIFKTIKYGWPDKGMKSWKEDFSPMQIAQVSSYIKSLVGTNPPNQKAAEGDLFVEEDKSSASDVTHINTTIPEPDSLQKQ